VLSGFLSPKDALIQKRSH